MSQSHLPLSRKPQNTARSSLLLYGWNPSSSPPFQASISPNLLYYLVVTLAKYQCSIFPIPNVHFTLPIHSHYQDQTKTLKYLMPSTPAAISAQRTIHARRTRIRRAVPGRATTGGSRSTSGSEGKSEESEVTAGSASSECRALQVECW